MDSLKVKLLYDKDNRSYIIYEECDKKEYNFIDTTTSRVLCLSCFEKCGEVSVGKV